MKKPTPISDDLRTLFDAACSDTLTDEQVVELEERLRDDPARLRAYLEYFNLQSNLHFLTRYQRAAKASLASVADNVHGEGETACIHVPAKAGPWRRLREQVSGTTPLSLVVAAVVVSGMIGLMAVVIVPPRQGHEPGARILAVPEFVAQVTRNIDSQWSDENARYDLGDHLPEGHRLSLQQGMVEVTYRSGARVILQGPTTFVLASEMGGVLENGRITVNVPQPAQGFAVQTPLGKVVDLGTQFGVSMDQQEQSAQVHVFVGRVQLETPARSGGKPVTRLLNAGDAIKIFAARPPQILAVDEASFVRNVLPLAEALPAPRHQWTFNDGTANDQVGGAHGQLEAGASIADGQLHLDGGANAIMRTAPIDEDIHAKTLVSWVSLNTLDQAGGSILTLESNDGGTFDGIVYGERMPRQWMAGSDGFVRSPENNSGKEETQTAPTTVMMAIVYRSDGSILIYRNGVIYAGYRTKDPPIFTGGTARAIFGRRHSNGENWQMAAAIDEARIYSIPLSPHQIRQLFEIGPSGTASTARDDD